MFNVINSDHLDENDATAERQGFTREVCADNAQYSLYLRVQPGADLSGSFKAWDYDNQEWLRVDGWQFEVFDYRDGPRDDPMAERRTLGETARD